MWYFWVELNLFRLFVCLFIYVLPLEIQLSIWEGLESHTFCNVKVTPQHCCACPKPGPIFVTTQTANTKCYTYVTTVTLWLSSVVPTHSTTVTLWLSSVLPTHSMTVTLWLSSVLPTHSMTVTLWLSSVVPTNSTTVTLWLSSVVRIPSVPCSFWKGQVKHWQKRHPKRVGEIFRAHQVSVHLC